MALDSLASDHVAAGCVKVDCSQACLAKSYASRELAPVASHQPSIRGLGRSRPCGCSFSVCHKWSLVSEPGLEATARLRPV